MPSKQLFMVRIALISGVLMFAGLTLFQRRAGMPVPDDTLRIEMLRYVLWVLAGTAALVAVFLKPKVESATGSRRSLFTLIGWSVGEGAALLGIILHFLGGPVTSLSLGILAFAFTLLMLPVPRDRR